MSFFDRLPFYIIHSACWHFFSGIQHQSY